MMIFLHINFFISYLYTIYYASAIFDNIHRSFFIMNITHKHIIRNMHYSFIYTERSIVFKLF